MPKRLTNGGPDHAPADAKNGVDMLVFLAHSRPVALKRHAILVGRFADEETMLASIVIPALEDGEYPM